MKQQLAQKIVTDFPDLFVFSEEEKQTLPMPLFGFEIGNGWFPIVYELVRKLSALSKETGQPVKVVQVKEKFGGLRFYFDGPDEWEVYVEEAMEKCTQTCEICGKPGKLQTTAWLTTSCEEHKKEIHVLSDEDLQSLLKQIEKACR